MTSRREQIKINKQPVFWLQQAAGWSFILFFSFFILFSPRLHVSGSIKKPGKIKKHVHHATATFAADDHQSGHLPLGSGEAPAEPNYPDESESEDNLNDGFDELYAHLFLKDGPASSANKALLLALLQSIENRSKVSLVILYHSWKSFLI